MDGLGVQFMAFDTSNAGKDESIKRLFRIVTSKDALKDVLDELSQLELENLATFFYARHWSQNINIPVIVDNDEDEDTADDVNSKYSFRMTKDEKAIFSSAVSLNVSDLGVHRQNALLQLTKYLRAASLTVGYRAYIDAIIQLARWGERKPTLLIVDSLDSLADMAMFSCPTLE